MQKISLFVKSISFLGVLGFLLMTSTLSCTKTTETIDQNTLEQYYPLIPGKYIKYNVDSLEYTNFGKDSVRRFCQVMMQVDSQIMDNTGVPVYRIFRYERPDSTSPWIPQGTLAATNTKRTIVYTENNLKYIKLQFPVEEYNSWKGNMYLDSFISRNYDYQYLLDWDYYYSNIGESIQFGNETVNDIITVNQRNEVLGYPESPNDISTITLAYEKYAKGIGMVYKKFKYRLVDQQNCACVNNDVSYEVVFTMYEHN